MVARTVHRYGAHAAQVVELFMPDAPVRGVVVVIHGGFWRNAYDRHLMDDLCADLAGGGWAAWNLEYRRTAGGDGGWPETFLDVAAGIDLLAGANEFREPSLRPERVVAIGHSAGGHLALWAAGRARLPAGAPGSQPVVRITHAVAQAGVVDLARAARLELSERAAELLLGVKLGEDVDRWRLASPAELVPLGVPQLLVHGENDAIVPVALTHAYVDVARVAGDSVEAVVLPGVGHFEHLDPGSSAWAAVRAWLPQ